MTLKSIPFFITVSAAVNCHSNINKKLQERFSDILCWLHSTFHWFFRKQNSTKLNSSVRLRNTKLWCPRIRGLKQSSVNCKPVACVLWFIDSFQYCLQPVTSLRIFVILNIDWVVSVEKGTDREMGKSLYWVCSQNQILS